MQAAFLLIGDREDSPWFQALKRALAPLGDFEVVSERGAVQRTLQRDYPVVIVDAAVVDDVPLLVSRLRAQQPEIRIVVATASPTWRRARDALQAGAMDYIRKSLSEGELLSTFKDILAGISPPWPP
jgi:DNA-binding NarL/FixJ family response regulator